jgi:hypothetical protein
MQRALDEVHPGRGVLFGRSGWSGQQATGMLWGGDQASDFWSLRVLVAAAISAAATRFSNWSHDVGGYLGHRLAERCPAELLVRWAQLGCFTPLMQAHGRMVQEPWTYDERTLDIYRAYVLLHERLVPYIRAAAATARRSGLPIIRPLHLTDPDDDRGWTIADAYGFGPALWVAPVLDEGARSREVALPRGRLDRGVVGRARARRRRGRRAGAPGADPGLGAQRLDRRDPSRPTRRPGDGRHARARATARGDAVGGAAPRSHRRTARRQHEDRLEARALVRRPRAQRDLRRAPQRPRGLDEAEHLRAPWRSSASLPLRCRH